MRPAELLDRHRAAIRQVVAAHHVGNPRVFGSVAHGEDAEASDLGLLGEPQDQMSLFDLGANITELNDALAHGDNDADLLRVWTTVRNDLPRFASRVRTTLLALNKPAPPDRPNPTA